MRLRLLKNFIFLGLVTILQSFGLNDATADRFNYQLMVNLDGEDFQTLSKRLYYQVGADETNLKLDVFQKAVKGYLVLDNQGRIQNERFLTILDYSLSSSQKRLFVIDLEEKKIAYELLTAHGKYSGNEYARSFSNSYNSKKSCLGFLTTGEIYNGRHRLSLKLHGLEYGYNNNAYNRGIVFHGAYYVDDKIVEEGQSIGRSFGCPAVPSSVNGELVKNIKNGSCVFFYYPWERYLQRSSVLNADTYVPIEQLKALVE